MIIFSAVMIVLLTGVLILIPLGLRAGERSGDAILVDARPQASPRTLRVMLVNPGELPVIVGLSLRRPVLRLRLEGGAYARARRRTSAELLPGSQAAIGAVAPGETGSFTVPVPAGLGGGAELVAVIGQQERLRTIHRLVQLPPGCEVAEPASGRVASVGARAFAN